MAGTSTVPTVKAQLVDVVTAALTGAGEVEVPVTYAWPGKSTLPECVFLGPHPETADIRLDRSSQIATIKAGRKHRQENYTVRLTIWSFRPELEPADAQECEERAFELLAPIEDALAGDARIGLPPATVQKAEIADTASTLFPFKSGWACELAIDIAVDARLT